MRAICRPDSPARRPTLLGDRRGATAIEYALLVALVAITTIIGVSALGGSVGGMWAVVGERLFSAFGGG